MRAYVLIHIEPGAGRGVQQEIAGLAGVVSAQTVAGPYDVIAVAEGHTLEDIVRHVLRRIDAIPGVTRTLTCPVVRS